MPLTELTHKGEPFVWTKKREQCFQELKKRLTIAPILALPRALKGFLSTVMCHIKFWVCFNTKWESYCVCFQEVKATREELPYSRLGVSNYLCFEDMAALLVWGEM